MTLTNELKNFQQQFMASQSSEIKSVMVKATEDLVQTQIAENSLQTGDEIPDFTLKNATGKSVNIKSLLAQGKVVISFYRGSWCPYCNLELKALEQSLPRIKALGANLVAISPETPDNSLSTTEKNNLTFEVLSDLKNQIARQFGLVFTLPEKLRPIYEQFGIDIPAHNGDKTFELPLPATYVIDNDGKILHSFINADYTQRLDPQTILEVLEKN